MSEKRLAEKALQSEMVEVRVKLYRPFYEFLQQYHAFFTQGTQSLEDLCRDLIYGDVCRLYTELEGFVKEHKHLDVTDFYQKWHPVAIVAFEEEQLESPEPDC